MASAMPPLAVPSSFVSTMPVTSVASRNSIAWRRPFWPVVASIVSSVSCGASGICFGDHLRTLASSSIRCCWVCRRPAVSHDHHVARRAPSPASIASKTTEAGSEPSAPRTNSEPAPLGPHLELLDRGGAEGVPGPEQHREPELLREVPGDLADRRGLAGAVDAHDQDHGRARGAGRSCPRPTRGGLGEQLAQPAGQVLARLQVARRGLGLEAPRRSWRWWAPRRRRRSASPRGARRPRRRGARTGWPGARRRGPARVLDMFSRRRRKKPRLRSSPSASAPAATGAHRARSRTDRSTRSSERSQAASVRGPEPNRRHGARRRQPATTRSASGAWSANADRPPGRPGGVTRPSRRRRRPC